MRSDWPSISHAEEGLARTAESGSQRSEMGQSRHLQSSPKWLWAQPMLVWVVCCRSENRSDRLADDRLRFPQSPDETSLPRQQERLGGGGLGMEAERRTPDRLHSPALIGFLGYDYITPCYNADGRHLDKGSRRRASFLSASRA